MKKKTTMRHKKNIPAGFGVVLLFVALSACGTVEKKEPLASTGGEEKHADKAAETGGSHTEKPSAPVSIEGKLDGGQAALELVFETDATNVSVTVWGTDGVTVTSAKDPIQNRRVAKGERLTLDVSFVAPTNRADVAVSVRGQFGGKELSKVRSFTVNPAAPPLTNAPGEVKTGPDGQPVRVMKAQ